jgi:hypothetical protein
VGGHWKRSWWAPSDWNHADIFGLTLGLKLEDPAASLEIDALQMATIKAFQRMNPFHDFDISLKTRKAGTWGDVVVSIAVSHGAASLSDFFRDLFFFHLELI